MLGIIGKKIGMTSIYNDQGHAVACTLLEAGPCVVTQIKKINTDGYEAIQLGYDEKKEKNTTKPLAGHFKKANTTPKKKLVEFRNFSTEFKKELTLGQFIRIEDIFEEGDYVDAIGTAKGKGFQGVVKRHGFRGVGDQTHGQHNRERAPGSIGGASFPARVFKGIRMAGRTGGHRTKTENLRVMKIVPEKNLIVVSGAVPGARTSYVILQK